MGRHPNAPLTPEGRRRLCERIDAGRPIAHVAAEAGISRQVLSKWYGRWCDEGEEGLQDKSSRPDNSPTATREGLVELIVAMRRAKKWGPARIAAALELDNIDIAPATVHRWLVKEGLSRLRDMDPPTGEQMRQVVRYEHLAPGDMIHVDIKKLGRIPDGGGWRVHGRDTEAGRASKRGKGRKVGYVYIHSAVDDYTRIAYSEALPDEKGGTAAGFWRRAAVFYADYGIHRLERCLTDNGSCYRSRLWALAMQETGTTHKRTRPHTPKTNGKVERYNGTLSREWAYNAVYHSDAERTAALAGFVDYYNHDRPHQGIGRKPPVSRAPIGDVRVAAHRLFIPPDEPKVDTEMTLFNPDDVVTPDQPGVTTTS